jgi:hypothetical protein
MKPISVTVAEEDYEAFREAAQAQGRSIADLIREAMTYYRAEQLEARAPLDQIPVLAGHRLKTKLPSRSEIYDEVFEPKAKS